MTCRIKRTTQITVQPALAMLSHVIDSKCWNALRTSRLGRAQHDHDWCRCCLALQSALVWPDQIRCSHQITALVKGLMTSGGLSGPLEGRCPSIMQTLSSGLVSSLRSCPLQISGPVSRPSAVANPSHPASASQPNLESAQPMALGVHRLHATILGCSECALY